jgi:hypothetical protein
MGSIVPLGRLLSGESQVRLVEKRARVNGNAPVPTTALYARQFFQFIEHERDQTVQRVPVPFADLCE